MEREPSFEFKPKPEKEESQIEPEKKGVSLSFGDYFKKSSRIFSFPFYN
jgi:hypothetical protein